MKIAIDISPLESGHKVRGVGFYLTYLKRALITYFPEHEYHFFTSINEVSNSIDIIHYPYFDPFFRTLPFTKKHKTVVTVHDVTPLLFPEHFPAGIKGNINWQIQKYSLGRVDGIITDSEASKKDICRITGFSERKMSVAYLAGGEEFKKLESEDIILKNIKKKFNLSNEFILYVGDVTWNKNLPRLLKAIEKLDIPLVMVGKSLVSNEFDKQNIWNADLIEVQRLAEQNKNVIRLGFVPTEDLVALYNLATVFVFPSVYEGFGLPIVEAMRSGTPVIISREGCMPEVGGNAVEYFDGYDTENLTNVLRHVLHSKKMQKELSENGLEQAKKFSWKKTAEQTLEAYKKALTK